ncbi:MAG: carbohydrate binding family 9 domain-containing protein [Acidobacteria bacterium]|nr:carbohydrate binding family 9 domain-containing protein [Acidobacteriota bacterium]
MASSALWAHSKESTVPTLTIPYLSSAPVLDNFLNMKPEGATAERMAKVTGLVQRNPHDGEPVSQPTEVYLGYDKHNLYVVFVCFDDPTRVRAHRTRREDIGDDDEVEIMLDTFRDQRRAYAFQTNPLGIQWDAIYTENTEENAAILGDYTHFDSTFDTLWYSRGRLTSRGFVVWFAIPFRSLRFRSLSDDGWGIILYRGIVRENEDSFWPAMSSKVEGRLGRAAVAYGMKGIAPGRNIQLIPYGLFNSFHSLDTSDPAVPHFDNRLAGGKVGLDSKLILRESLVMDLTANPDFSQVESDDPQVTVNQRFEVFFPEKRPFFMENTDSFRTPINLLFTRRIADPDFGTRLSGRIGHYALGLLLADDKSPGEVVPPLDPDYHQRAYFAIGRVNRDIFRQSTIGAIYTDREFHGSYNRIGGLDTRLKLSSNWTAMFQGVVSSTHNQDGSYQAGPAYKADVVRSGLHFNYEAIVNDFSPGFTSEAGFVNRVNIREIQQTASYRFRPKTNLVVDWGPDLIADDIWDHSGLRLDTSYITRFHLQLKRQTYVFVEPYVPFRQRLRPVDFSVLPGNVDYYQHYSQIFAQSSPLNQVSIYGQYNWGDAINYVPPANRAPFLAFSDWASAGLTVRPLMSVKVDNVYYFTRLKERTGGATILDNHIIRNRWNWQINNELSLRFIVQYSATLANQSFTSLASTKQLSPQFLITYLAHPGTALYVGYNSDLQNIDPALGLGPSGNLLRTRDRLINDDRVFFVKVSYLLRF